MSATDEGGQVDTQAIRARVDAATEGPWLAEYSGEQGNCVLPPGAESTREAVAVARLYRSHADAEFIAHARTDIPKLLDEVERLHAQVTDLTENPRDEHHTMDELYDYRMLYNAHAAHGWHAAGIPVVKSWRHSDGEECFGGGWFIVTATLPSGQVSNHYKAEFWGMFRVPVVDIAPEWDGHTPTIASQRLRTALVCDCDDLGTRGEVIPDVCPVHPDAALAAPPGPDVDRLTDRLRSTALHHGWADAMLMEEAASAIETLALGPAVSNMPVNTAGYPASGDER